MAIYIVQRLAAMAAIVVVMSIVIFATIYVLPGSAAVLMLGEYATPESIAALERKLGLDDPLWVQYWRWASGALAGNFGDSLVLERPVAPMIGDALASSAILAGLTMVFVTVLGVGFGVLCAVYRGSPLDHALSVTSYLGVSVPEFFFAILFVIVFAAYLGWLPAHGYAPLSEGVGRFAAHLVLPVATLTLALLAHVLRQTRSSMIETMRQDYVRAARARGVPERVVVMRHALRNALLPIITVLAYDVGWLIGGVVVVETVFGYPGLGRLMLFAIERHDFPIIQASVLVMTFIFAMSNLAADLLYAFVNPKIRYGRSVG